ncbi:MAG: hypothetical protein AAGI88_15450 [Pseudomonadota bacterium]
MKLRPDEEEFVASMAVDLKIEAKRAGWEHSTETGSRYRGGWQHDAKAVERLTDQVRVLETPMASLVKRAENLQLRYSRNELPLPGDDDPVEEFLRAVHQANFALSRMRRESEFRKASLPSAKYPRNANFHLHYMAIFFTVGEFDGDRPTRVRSIAAACMDRAGLCSEPSERTVGYMLSEARQWFDQNGTVS